MKKFKDVEENRKNYHADAAKNSVHRASLLVPEIEGATAQVSFLNHFLIKRGYEKTACRITGLDKEGKRIYSKYFPVTQPRVYSYNLTELFDGEAQNYMVEFFSSENLFIPFPAVMVNHEGPSHINTVHAYNRILNDVFENDAINANHVKEASIDVLIDDEFDTFVCFQAGQEKCVGELTLDLVLESGEKLEKKINLDVPRFGTEKLYLGELFNIKTEQAVLKVGQPAQSLFYGRILAGIQERSTKAFSANHSYYDSSETQEYWDENLPSTRIYPFFNELDNVIRFYPVQSPGEVDVSIVAYDKKGNNIGIRSVESLLSPSNKVVEASVNTLFSTEKDIASFEVVAKGLSKTPTRLNHQLVYQAAEGKLASSINVSLFNKQVYQPSNKKWFSWGQLIHSEKLESSLGIVSNFKTDEKEEIEISFWDQEGPLAVISESLSSGSKILFNTKDDVSKITEDKRSYVGQNIWFAVKSNKISTSSFIVTKHLDSDHCSGEHSY